MTRKSCAWCEFVYGKEVVVEKNSDYCCECNVKHDYRELCANLGG